MSASTMIGRAISFTCLASAAFLICAPPAGAAAATSVDVAMVPATTTVAPGDTFTIEIRCTDAGLPFNGFTLSIGYDPAALTLLPMSPPSLQEGSLMTGACGNTFHLFQAAGDSAQFTDVLLCASVLLTGPGQLYVLRFVAGQAAVFTTVVFRTVQFFDAGSLQGPVVTSGASISIGSATGVTPTGTHGSLRLRVEPNPARGAVRLGLDGTVAGTVRVIDLAGRVVRHMAGAGAREWRWDGTDDHGAPVAPGVYLAVGRAGELTALTRFVLLR